ncbi:MAG TPA: helix-turn-helix domain-containing protein [Candidatus Limnocylindria bacterium]|nr:helix-turn-helix domain-containing protein [Candidatus Limnocylindria bacterium]
MTGLHLGRVHRALRVKADLRQCDVASRAGVSRQKVSRLERGQMAGLTWQDLERCYAALGARLDVRVLWRGAALDRLLDERHAALSGHVVRLLSGNGWLVKVEATFSHYGERGSIDILAWHPASRNLLIVEIKSELGALEGLLRSLDVKARIGPLIARGHFGASAGSWPAAAVSRLVVLPEDSGARRAVARHDQLLASALPLRSQAVRRWLRVPEGGAIAGLWFLSADRGVSGRRNPSAVRRVRRTSSADPHAAGRLA